MMKLWRMTKSGMRRRNLRLQEEDRDTCVQSMLERVPS